MLLQASESALCSWLSREAPCFAFASIDDGPMESDVVPHVVEDPIVLLCSVMSCASSGFTNICGYSHKARSQMFKVAASRT